MPKLGVSRAWRLIRILKRTSRQELIILLLCLHLCLPPPIPLFLDQPDYVLLIVLELLHEVEVFRPDLMLLDQALVQ